MATEATDLIQPASTLDLLRDNFPFPTIRPTQDLALGVVAQSYDQGTQFTVIEAPTGAGKCFAPGTPILYFDGTIRSVESVETGDILMGDDSTPRTVLGTTQGTDEMFDVVPKKGPTYRVNSAHLLSLRYTKGTGSKGVHRSANPTLRNRGLHMSDGAVVDIPVTEYLKLSKTQKHLLKGFRVPVEFSKVCVPLDPYFLGLWLGDGSSKQPEVTSADPEIVAFLQIYADTLGLQVTPYLHDGCGTYNITSGQRGGVPDRNPLLIAMRSIGLINNKHIPLVYKTATRKIRLAVLAGLVDSDGHRSHGGLEFTFKSKLLAHDVEFLCRSLGLAAYTKPCLKRCTNSPDPEHVGTYFRISVSGTVLSEVPIRIPRKKFGERMQRKNVLNVGIDVLPVGVGPYYGFQVDGNGRFLLGDCTVTHNSGIALAPARWSAQGTFPESGAHYLTSQNSLSRQLLNDFGHFDLVQIRGKNNYYCEKHNVNCTDGSMLNNGPACEGCPYRAEKNRYLSGKLGVTNYTYYLTETRYSGELAPREYLVLDEAHNIEREILACTDITITQRRCEEIGAGRLPLFSADDDNRTRDWLGKVFMVDLRRQCFLLDEDMESYRASGEDIPLSLQKRYNSLRQLHGNLQEYLEGNRNEWLAWSDTKDGHLLIKPLSAAGFAQRFLFTGTPNILMLSATILDFQTFRRNLGIEEANLSTFAVPSEFPLKNRRIVYWPVGSMSSKNIEATLPRLAQRTEALLTKYADKKGIIHTHSYRINAYLEEALGAGVHGSRIVTHTNLTGSREQAISSHYESPGPTMLMSPSMTEGLDLKDDLSRLQIITKVPYPFLDPYNRTRMQRDPRWYQLQTALTLVQATGRSVRSAEDYALTVILDEDFGRFLTQNQDILPKWWLDSIEFR